ncbi:hypothetical protein GGS24DRAFT_514321 [Hypoxylon argillaceum]|nr:hypothetical protein GGS24DRAFT_514321 [Hypoxylon argillaceum]KAI1154109.1 hypothetical protein F4825DRAFT_448895 [Nemania diffusa]
MRFSIALSAFIAGAAAVAVTPSNLDMRDIEQRAVQGCGCIPDCGCPSGSTCFCLDQDVPFHPSCYPGGCGCPGSGIPACIART